MNGRLVILPLGELEQGGHDYGTCIRCGASARTEPCRPTVYPATCAAAVVCVDTIECEKRRYRAEQIHRHKALSRGTWSTW